VQRIILGHVADAAADLAGFREDIQAETLTVPEVAGK